MHHCLARPGAILVGRLRFVTAAAQCCVSLFASPSFLPAWPVVAAERYFDFSGARLKEPPPGFRSTVSGEGRPGEWKIVEDEASAQATLTNVNPSVTLRRQALAQLSRDTTDEHFPAANF